MTFEEARERYPWLEFDRDEYRVNLRCSACNGLETFSALMLEHDFMGDLMKVKPVRFHIPCGQAQQVPQAPQVPQVVHKSAARAVAVKTGREISFTDE
ncbi:MAG TPA: hypothetical protein VFY05_04710 [Candidatus Angelobacter sp.]|nr:hypothetical protein [Candidatus Angelobacter sp.]